jgi:hypothetical protein
MIHIQILVPWHLRLKTSQGLENNRQEDNKSQFNTKTLNE